MRFDPKLIHPEEPPLATDGEIELPGELSALAEQLRSDAAYLAARYPADGSAGDQRHAWRSDVPRSNVSGHVNAPGQSGRVQADLAGQHASWWSSESPSGRTAMAAAGVMTACAVSLLLAMVLWMRPMHQPAETAGREASAAPATKADLPAIPPPNHLHVSNPATVSLADLSSPELEALLDLSSGEPGRMTSVSF